MPGDGWDHVGGPARGGEDDLLVPFTETARLVAETSEVVGQIDLVQADHRQCVQFRRLSHLYVEQSIALIEMIEEHGPDIRRQLEAMLRVS